MNKVSRNDPCPCGSGKKYKKCCIDNVLSFPTPDNFEGGDLKDARGILEMVKEEFSNKEFGSLEDLNKELSTFYMNYNDLPKKPFLGLSPSQMHIILNSQFSLDNEVFKIEIVSHGELLQVPIFNQALYFLNKLLEVGELRATQKGNLPKVFVIEMYENFFSKEKYARKPNKEDDLPQLTRLKHLLDISGLIKKRSNKFSLTKKGISVLEKDIKMELFETLLINFSNKWNWAFMDSYAELNLIQRSVVFNILLLHKKCVGWTLDKDLGQSYIDAFPELVREVPHESYFTLERQVINCFIVRFLDRFCLPLGIVEHKEVKEKTKEKWKSFNLFEYYKPTAFFEKNFKFKVK